MSDSVVDESAVTEHAESPSRAQRGGFLGRSWNRFSNYYPFTVSGTVLFVLAVYLLGRSVVSRNAYGLAIAVAAIFALMLLALLGRWQAERLSKAEATWDFSAPLYARTSGDNPVVQLNGAPPRLFFRVHVVLLGRLVAGRKALLSFHRDVASENPRRIELPLFFPLCGRIEFRTEFHIGDVFGLTRSRFGTRQLFALPVQPAPFSGSQIPPIQAAGGDKETSRTKQPDEERYYMREYVPGDRFRDINWKASSRLTQLYTRTSPVTQEQTQIVTVHFRHFLSPGGKHARETMESLAQLNVLKSWLIAYLFRVKREHPEFHFRVVTGRGTTVLESEEDIHEFSRSVSDLNSEEEPPFIVGGPGDDEAPAGDQDRRDRDSTVFSTAYDDGLSGFLQTQTKGLTTVYRTVFGPKPARGTGGSRGTGGPGVVRPAPSVASSLPVPNVIRFSVLGKEFFPTLSAFLPARFVPVRERDRTNPPVQSGQNIELVERKVLLEW
ncbi:MAG TPA: DUF58 domain-containing protein [Spirochaetia bacterium]|nr:DUF58 domain-containing protein [Spirochaetia bacterium]